MSPDSTLYRTAITQGDTIYDKQRELNASEWNKLQSIATDLIVLHEQYLAGGGGRAFCGSSGWQTLSYVNSKGERMGFNIIELPTGASRDFIVYLGDLNDSGNWVDIIED